MRSRAFRILFLAFQAVWLNAIVPGHTRGALTLPGSAAPSCDAGESTHSCCAAKRPRDSHNPTPADRARCALCFFAARITPPPAIDLAPPKLDLLCVCPVATGYFAESAAPRLAYHGRAPPTVAA